MGAYAKDWASFFAALAPAASELTQETQKLYQQHYHQWWQGFAGAWAYDPFEPFQQAVHQSSMVIPSPISLISVGALQPFFASVMQAFQHSLSQVPIQRLGQLQAEYAQATAKLQQEISLRAKSKSVMPATMADGVDVQPKVPSQPVSPQASLFETWLGKDKRFASKAWQDGGIYEALTAWYGLNCHFTRKMVQALPDDCIEKKRVEFVLEQWLDAMSPANSFATNPEAQQKLIESDGESLKHAVNHMLVDLRKGRISQTDESAFEVGVNVATTPGHVVYQNDVFQLIQYLPTQAEMSAVPLLIVPPCINKFYILDLQQDNSLVRYALDQGQAVFLLSWKNPKSPETESNWDDYVQDGVLRAIELVQRIRFALIQPKAGLKKDGAPIHVLGFCVGGTLLATALSVLAQRKALQNEHLSDDILSVTFLTTLLDFSDPGSLGVFISEEQVRAREELLGKKGLMPGRDLASAFSALRPNDLIWNYVVSNYLKGEQPAAFDLLYWNSDSTNLPGPLFCWYLRNTYLENRICVPGRAVVCGLPVDLRHIDVPAYILATQEDHIVPWGSAYASTQLLARPVRFVLGASGHIAGVINSARKNKRHYFCDEAQSASKRTPKGDRTPLRAEDWLNGATQKQGSWWVDWANWLAKMESNTKSKSVAKPEKRLDKAFAKAWAKTAPDFAAIEPAPGRYVKEKV